jgi:hypothetical protein
MAKGAALDNHGTILNFDNGTISHAVINNYMSANMTDENANSYFNTLLNVTLNNRGNFTSMGGIYLPGNLVHNYATGTIKIHGPLSVHYVQMNNAGVIDTYATTELSYGGRIYNTGTFNSHYALTIVDDNAGSFINAAGGTFNNLAGSTTSIPTRSATKNFYNNGTTNNYGVITNENLLPNYGVFNNDGTLSNVKGGSGLQPVVANYGTFYNNPSGTINNGGSFVEECRATYTNQGTFNGNAVVAGCGIVNVASTSGSVSSSPYQITIPSFDVGAGSNRLLVVGVSANSNSVSSIEFVVGGGSAYLTQAASSFYNNDAELWYLVNPTGTGNILVTFAGPTAAVVGAYAFAGVNQTDPIPTTAADYGSGSPSISVTTQYANSWVLDLPSIWGGVMLGSPSCTQQWDVNVPNAITGASSSTIVASPGQATCGWTASNGDSWDDVAIEIMPAG